jgi:hypothetical protein
MFFSINSVGSFGSIGSITSFNNNKNIQTSLSYWSLLGSQISNGTNGTINAIFTDYSNNCLYIGGTFTTVYDLSNVAGLLANNIASWDISNSVWRQFGNTTFNGTNDTVSALTLDSSNNQLYVGGHFTTVQDLSNTVALSANRIANWDISNNVWNQFGNTISNGTNDIVNALAFDPSNNQLYIGGSFTKANDDKNTNSSMNKITQNISSYNIITNQMENISQVGETSGYTNGTVNSTFTDYSNNCIYIGGTFTIVYDSLNIGGISARNVAIWDITNNIWRQFGNTSFNGTNTTVSALLLDSSNNQLYVGGLFTTVQDISNTIALSVNYVASWDISNNVWKQFGNTLLNGTNNTVNALSLDISNNQLYIGGSFTKADDKNSRLSMYQTTKNVASYVISKNEMENLSVMDKIGGYTNGIVLATFTDYSNNCIYVGGTFTIVFDSTNTGGISARNIARWDISNNVWRQFGNTISNGTSSTVHALALDISNNQLYVGGVFTTVQDISNTIALSANRIASWDISNNVWKQFGNAVLNGTNNIVRTLELNSSNNQLYVGGDFTNADDNSTKLSIFQTTQYIGAYNTNTNEIKNISEINKNGGYTNGRVNVFLTDYSNNCIYVGGGFTTVFDSSNIGGISANRIASWDISNNVWRQFGNSTSNGTNNQVNALSLDPSRNQLYVGGEFQTVKDTTNTTDLSVKRVAIWDITNSIWRQFGNSSFGGPDNSVHSLALDPSNNKLYVGGQFSSFRDTSNTVSLIANKIAIWDISNSIWRQFGNNNFNGLDGPAYAMEIDISRNQLYIGGDFTGSLNGINSVLNNTRYIVNWDINNNVWRPFGNTLSNGPNYRIYALALDSSNNQLYVGGEFTFIPEQSSLSTNRIARWDISNNVWRQFGNTSFNGTNSNVFALALDSSNNQLYVGGDFTTVQDTTNTTVPLSTNKIARWDISNNVWKQFGDSSYNGTDSRVLAIGLNNNNNNNVYFGGFFTSINVNKTNNHNRITRWDISSSVWRQFGDISFNGTNNSVLALSLDSSRNQLYVGGSFTTVQDTTNTTVVLSAKRIARWDISNNIWRQFGNTTYNGTDSSVNSLIIDSSNNQLYVGGQFTTVQDTTNVVALSAKRIARWDITNNRWRQFGTNINNGTDNTVYSLLLDSSKNQLYVGGQFTKANDKSNNVSQYIGAYDITNNKMKNISAIGVISGYTNGLVNATFTDYLNNCIYVGGTFTIVYDTSNIDGISAKNIASWDISKNIWKQFGNTLLNGTNNTVNALLLDPSNNQLYVGGAFTKADSENTKVSIYQYTRNVAAYNIITNEMENISQADITGGYTNGSVNTTVTDYSNNCIYVGGTFTTVFDSTNTLGISANRIARWDISNNVWSQFGNTTSNGTTGGNVFALSLNVSTNQLYVGGTFTSVQDTTNTSLSANRIARWDISKNIWSQFGNTTSNGTNNPVLALSLDNSRNQLYVGGQFTNVQDTTNSSLSAKNIASWDISNSVWRQFGNTTYNGTTGGNVFALSLNVSTNQLFVGGDFTTVQDTTNTTVPLSAKNIARWDISNSVWRELGNTTFNGTNGKVNALSIDISNNQLYVGGQFTTVQDTTNIKALSANRIARWDITNNVWKKIGISIINGTNNNVNALSLDTSNNELHVGGSFTIANDKDTKFSQYIGAYDTTTNGMKNISTVGINGGFTNGLINSTFTDYSNNCIYVGGTFTIVYDKSNIDGISARNIASWDISNNVWKQFGNTLLNGTNNTVNALLLDPSNNQLYVGGTFTKADDKNSRLSMYQTTQNVAAYNISMNQMENISVIDISSGYTNGLVLATFTDYSNNCIYVGGTFTVVFDSINIGGISARNIALWDISNNIWKQFGNTVFNGTNNSVRTISLDPSNNELYIGGDFTSVQDISNTTLPLSANYIARWDISNNVWRQFGNTILNGTNNIVRALELNSSYNQLYVGGDFTKADDISTKLSNFGNSQYISAYDINTNEMENISAIGKAGGYTNGPIVATLIDYSNNCIYVGGFFNGVFDSTASLSANNIARWDISKNSWSQFGNNTFNGTSNRVRALALDSSNNQLYVGGTFTSVQDTTNTSLSANRIARWDISNNVWRQFGNTTSNGTTDIVYALELDSSNNQLFVGGNFITVKDTTNTSLSANYIARWDISNNVWRQFGNTTSNGTTGTVRALSFDSSNNQLYVAGSFISVKDTTNTSLSANRIARWDISNNVWRQFGNTTYNGTSNTVVALLLDSLRNQLYVGGDFTTVQDTTNTSLSANRIARWDISNNVWRQFGNTTYNGAAGVVYAFQLDNSRNQLYVGGAFTTVQDISNTVALSANYLARWDISNNVWRQFGDPSFNGTNNFVFSISLNDMNNKVYIGGDFTLTNISITNNYNRIARWDISNSAWRQIGNIRFNGTNNTVRTLELDNSRNQLYVGGDFNTVQDTTNIVALSTRCIARWDISNNVWRQFGNTTYNGTINIVRALLLDISNNQLYVGGDFTTVQDTTNTIVPLSANRIARWDISNNIWRQFGVGMINGTNSSVNALLLDSSNNELHVGGAFTTANNKNTDVSQYIGAYDITNNKIKNVSAIGAISVCTNGLVNATFTDYSNNCIYVGGTFTVVYDTSNIDGILANRIASWDISNSVWKQFGNTLLNGTNNTVNALSLDPSNNQLYVGGTFTKAESENTKLLNYQITRNVAAYNIITNEMENISQADITGGYTNGTVLASFIDYSNNCMYIGGTFTIVFDSTNTGGISARNIAKWDISNNIWRQFGNNSFNGTNTTVNALSLDSSNNQLYVGGLFTKVQDISNTIALSTNCIARWDISTNVWSQFGNTLLNGTNFPVNALELDPSNNQLYVGGEFTKADDKNTRLSMHQTTRYIGAYNINTNEMENISAIGKIGGYTDGSVFSSFIDYSNNCIYVGGTFSTVFDSTNTLGISANRIARWDISNNVWSQFGNTTSNGTSSTVFALSLDSSNNQLYVGGFFTTVQDSVNTSLSANKIARWDISNNVWRQFGNTTSNGTTDGIVYALELDSSNNQLYLGGTFTIVKDTTNASLSANRIARWDISNNVWRQFGNTTSNGTTGQVSVISLDTSNNQLYVGGKFTTVNDSTTTLLSAKSIARWDISNNIWRQLTNTNTVYNGTSGNVIALSLDTSNNQLYVGGDFTTVQDLSNTTVALSANRIARWDISNNNWRQFGNTTSNGTTGQVSAISLDSSNNQLYVGGTFISVQDLSNTLALSANRIARWDISNNVWKQFGNTALNGVDNSVSSITLNSINNKIYFVGSYTSLNISITNNHNRITTWDISNNVWKQFGNTTSNGTIEIVRALSLDSSNNQLYVGGDFTTVKDRVNTSLSAKNIARWDISNSVWRQLGNTSYNGTNDRVFALALHPSKNELYVAGDFINVNDSSNIVALSAIRVARWDISNNVWRQLGIGNTNGTETRVNTLALDTSNNQLYVGGYFATVQDISNTIVPLSAKYIARWDISNNIWRQLGINTANGTASNVFTISLNSIKNKVYIGGSYSSVNFIISNNHTRVTRWDISNRVWRQLGNIGFNGTDNPVLALEIDPSNNQLYVGGEFTTVRDVSNGVNTSLSAKRIARWDISNNVWRQFGNTTSNGTFDGTVNALELDPSNNQLYMGGSFTLVQDSTTTSLSAKRIARWDISNNVWRQFGNTTYNGTFNGTVNALELDNSRNQLYVGGSFTLVQDTTNTVALSANRIARWDISNSVWRQLGNTNTSFNGTTTAVKALSLDSSNNQLYVGGDFTTVQDISNTSLSANRIARWDISNNIWRQLGNTTFNGTNDIVNSISLNNINNNVYFGGNFTLINSEIKTFNRIARWDISNNIWKQFGDSSFNGVIGGNVNSISMNNVTNKVYIGGDFTSLNINITNNHNRITRWDISNNVWRQFGNTTYNGTTTGQVNALSLDNSRNQLYVGGAFTAVQDTINIVALSAKGIARWDVSNNIWRQFGNTTSNGTNGNIKALALDVSINQLYVGGDFTSVQDLSNIAALSAKRIARWDISNNVWRQFGNTTSNGTFDGTVNALVLDPSNNQLYMGGSFTTVQDSTTTSLSAKRIARWDISNNVWRQFGNTTYNGTFDGTVNALELDNSRNQLYVGGSFTLVQDTTNTVALSANRIARWDISNNIWRQFGNTIVNGTNGNVISISLNNVNNNVYFGGEFTLINSEIKTFNRIARWDISNNVWKQFGTTANNGTTGNVNAISLNITNNKIYIGGIFNSVNINVTNNHNRITRWDISNSVWRQFGNTTFDGTNGMVRTLKLDNSRNQLYVGGDFTTVQDTTNTTVPLSANRIARWDISNNVWRQFGNTIYNGTTNGIVYALELDPSNNQLYVGGSFTIVQDTTNTSLSANRIARWDFSNNVWRQFGNTTSNGTSSGGYVFALALHPSRNQLYVGGVFVSVKDTTNTSLSANYIARWDISNNVWRQLGNTNATNGTNLHVNALSLDSSNNQLYVGGDFTLVQDISNIVALSANYIARWDISNNIWRQLGNTNFNGTNGNVRSISLNNINNNVYFGGEFTLINGNFEIKTFNRIASWDISDNIWRQFGDSSFNGVIGGNVNSISINNVTNKLYLGGDFTSLNINITNNHNRITRWDISSSVWRQFGNTTSNGTFNGTVNALELDPSNNQLYMGGSFTTVQDSTTTSLSANRIARWDISNNIWRQFGNTTSNGTFDGTVNALVLDPSNNQLYMGGSFTTVKDSTTTLLSAKRIARWDISNNRWRQFGNTTYNGTNNIVRALSLDKLRNQLYVGGDFTTVQDTTNTIVPLSANRVAIWDIYNNIWRQFGDSSFNGTNGIVNAISLNNINNNVYIGGQYSSLNINITNNHNRITSWDISNKVWRQFGNTTYNGTNNTVSALALHPSRNQLYVCGQFTTVQDTTNTTVPLSANYVASWDISNKVWRQFGNNTYNGTDSSVNALALHPSRNQLYVGGNFTSVQDNSNTTLPLSANYVARWDISNNVWKQLGNTTYNGTNNTVNALALNSSKNQLYVGGRFTTVKDFSNNVGLSANRIAKWVISNNVWKQFGDISFNGTNGTINALSLDPFNQLYVGGTFTTVQDASNTTIPLSANYVAKLNF